METSPQATEGQHTTKLAIGVTALAVVLSGCETNTQTLDELNAADQLAVISTPWLATDSKRGKEVANITIRDGAITAQYDGLPKDFREAIEDGIRDPLFQYIARDVPIKSVSAYKARHDGGEAFSVTGKDITLDISNGLGGNRIFTHKNIVGQVLVHEAVHLEAESWYSYIRNDQKGPPEQRKERIAVTNNCKQFRNRAYTTFIKTERTAIADAFLDIAQLPPYITKNDSQKLLYTVSDHIKSDIPDIYNKTRKQYSCEMPYVHELTELFGGRPVDASAEPMYTLYGKQIAIAAKDFTCITDGKFTADLYSADPDIAYTLYGHPWDNPTEFTASLISALHFNPKYVDECLDNLPAKQRVPLQRYAHAVLALTDPGILDILSREPEARALLEEFTKTQAHTGG